MNLFPVDEANAHKYILKINESINEFKTSAYKINEEKSHQFLQLIKHTDQSFLQSLGLQILGHALFTRHGKCHIITDKVFGLYPNSGLSQSAIQSMQKTNNLTKQLFVFKEKTPKIWVSPMVRTKQTAFLVIPKSSSPIIGYDISLTQNSNKPSSNYIMSIDQLLRQYQITSAFSQFSKVLNYKLSSIFFGNEKIYNKIQTLSNYADEKLKDLALNNQVKKRIQDFKMIQLQQGRNNEQEKIGHTSTQQQKLERVAQILNNQLNQYPCDVWIIGHSKNLKYFFKKKWDISNNFAFAETRRVYKVSNSKTSKAYYYIPPYYLVIDQESGHVKPKFQQDFMMFSSF